MNKRQYKIKFCVTIGEHKGKKNTNYMKYYMKKWSKFMSVIMPRKLSSIPTNSTASVKELPHLRSLITQNLKIIDLIDLLNQKDQDLARMLLEVAPLFDSSSKVLKAHILCVFGITASELQSFLNK